MPHYVGKADTLKDYWRRVEAHLKTPGRYNPRTDRISRFYIGDVSEEETFATEQATILSLGTYQKGVAGYNQRWNIAGRAGAEANKLGFSIIRKVPALRTSIVNARLNVLRSSPLPYQKYGVLIDEEATLELAYDPEEVALWVAAEQEH